MKTLYICTLVGNLTAQGYLSENCLLSMSELCRYPEKQQSVGTLPTPLFAVVVKEKCVGVKEKKLGEFISRVK